MIEQANNTNPVVQNKTTVDSAQTVQLTNNQLVTSEQDISPLKLLSVISSDIADTIKSIITIISTLSLVIGGCLLFYYFKVINATYLLTSPVDLVFLMTIVSIGFGLIIFALLFSFSVLPLSILMISSEFANSESSNTKVTLKWYIFAALVSPYLINISYILLQSYFPISMNYSLAWYVIFSIAIYSYFSFKIFQNYNAVEHSEQCNYKLKCFIYSFIQSLILFIGIFPVLPLTSVLKDSSIIGLLSQGSGSAILIALIISGFIILVQALFISSILLQNTSYKKKIQLILISSILGIVFILMLSFFSVVKSSIAVFSLRDAANSDHVYRFEYSEVNNELSRIEFLSKKTINNEEPSYKYHKNFLYLNYYAVVKFRDMLILCPKQTSSPKIVSDVIKQCIDLSDYNYDQIDYDFYQSLKTIKTTN